ncbi:GntR family transcriptional regulator [Pseudoalteromonas sp. C2R02]|uniref:UTRA domain-containing protein n=1 Tax=Pseudoalteromonas sp. C2R02 TaxID=2841565 RepID=UPI001C09BE93|nr:UTRA domain-containing protein [Pseudoalteromonas sp. C2R02]MBU2972675.1 GntR family transcriptional regulator [Pseudoalteromonas sp. C2R02]
MLLYQKIRQYVLELISNNSTKPSTKLPSERTLQEKFQSTRITVREALFRLEAEGLIYSQKRKGWFITPPKLKLRPASKVNFNKLAVEQGFVPKTEVISILDDIDDSFQSQEQDIFTGDALYHLKRVRLLDERPVMIEAIYCQRNRFEDFESKALSESITDIMAADYNVKITSERCVICVTALSNEDADILEKNSGAPCLKIIRKRFDEHGLLVDYNYEYWLHDAIEMLVEGT